MSTRIMGLCWPLKLPPTVKAVLISLADNANDSGYCWPSIDAICERTCFGRTAVIAAIRQLEASGIVVANRSNGRHTTYILVVANQSATRTGPGGEPVREANLTSPPGGLDQYGRRTLTVKNRQEPSRESARSPRGERLPPDFPTPAEIAFCRSERPDLDAGLLAEKFRDYWLGVPGAKGRKCDWPATWRNFVRSEMGPRRGQRRSAATESGLALAGLDRNTEAHNVVDVPARRLD